MTPAVKIGRVQRALLAEAARRYAIKTCAIVRMPCGKLGALSGSTARLSSPKSEFAERPVAGAERSHRNLLCPNTALLDVCLLAPLLGYPLSGPQFVLYSSCLKEFEPKFGSATDRKPGCWLDKSSGG